MKIMLGAPTYYFDKPGPINILDTIRLSIQRAKERGICHIVVSSLTGDSCLKLMNELNKSDHKMNVVCVTFRAGAGIDIDRLLDKLEDGDTCSELDELQIYLIDMKKSGVS